MGADYRRLSTYELNVCFVKTKTVISSIRRKSAALLVMLICIVHFFCTEIGLHALVTHRSLEILDHEVLVR